MKTVTLRQTFSKSVEVEVSDEEFAILTEDNSRTIEWGHVLKQVTDRGTKDLEQQPVDAEPEMTELLYGKDGVEMSIWDDC